MRIKHYLSSFLPNRTPCFSRLALSALVSQVRVLQLHSIERARHRVEVFEQSELNRRLVRQSRWRWRYSWLERMRSWYQKGPRGGGWTGLSFPDGFLDGVLISTFRFACVTRATSPRYSRILSGLLKQTVWTQDVLFSSSRSAYWS